MNRFGRAKQGADVHIEQLGHAGQRVQVGLAGVGAPLRHRCGVLIQLFGEPLTGALSLGQHRFDTIYTFHLDFNLLDFERKDN